MTVAESVETAIDGVRVKRDVRIRIRYRRCTNYRFDVTVTECDGGVEYSDGVEEDDGGGGVRSVIMVVVIVVRI